MTALEEYIKERIPLRGHYKVRFEMVKKAKQIADQFYPDDPVKNKVCYESYLLGMWDTLELVYS